jgi:transposase
VERALFDSPYHPPRAQVETLSKAVQTETRQSVKLGYVDQGDTGQSAVDTAQSQGIALKVIKLPEAKLGFILLPRRWVVECSFACLALGRLFNQSA